MVEYDGIMRWASLLGLVSFAVAGCVGDAPAGPTIDAGGDAAPDAA